MASGINLKKAQLAYNNVNKDIKNLETQLANFRKAVAEMNANIWYGGNSANKWYESANNAYKKDCKFLDSLYNIQVKLSKKIDSTLAVSGSTEKTQKSGNGSGTVGGSGSGSAGGQSSSLAGDGSNSDASTPPKEQTKGDPPGGGGDPDTTPKFSNESKKKAGISGQDYAKYGNMSTTPVSKKIVPANYGKSNQDQPTTAGTKPSTNGNNQVVAQDLSAGGGIYLDLGVHVDGAVVGDTSTLSDPTKPSTPNLAKNLKR